MKLKEAVAAEMEALLMEASEKKAVGAEGKPPEEWMADDVSS